MLSFILQLLLLASGLVEVRLFAFSTLAWALALQGVLKVTRPVRLVGRVTKVTEINKPKVNKNAGILIDLRGGGATTADLPSFPMWNKKLVGNFHQVDFWVNKGKLSKLITLFTPEGAQGVVSLRVTRNLGLIFFHHSVGDKVRVKHIDFRLKRKLVCCNPQDLPKALRKRHLFPDGVGPVYGQTRYYGNGLYKVTLRCDHPNN